MIFINLIESIQPISYEQQINTNQNSSSNLLAMIRHDIKEGINTVKENIAYGLDSELTNLEDASQLINNKSIDIFDIKIVDNLNLGSYCSYTVAINNRKIFIVTSMISKTRFPAEHSFGDEFIINLKDGFNQLYNQIHVSDHDVIDDSEISDDEAEYIVN